MQNSNIETVKEKLFSTKNSSEKMNDGIRRSIDRLIEARFRRIRPSEFEGELQPLSDEDYAKISELSDFIAEHIKEVGKEQTILDFQVGLTLLNGYKKESISEEKVKLEEDSDFGEKTYAAMFKAMEHFSLPVIQKYIKLGAMNNTIWNTKNIQKINTDIEVEELNNKMKEREV